MRKILDWLCQPYTTARYSYLILALFLWFTIFTQLWDYFTVSRPLHQCLEHHEVYCRVNGVSYFVEYRS